MEEVVTQLLTHDAKLGTAHAGVIGVDEAGRGPLAGSVVAAAVWLPMKTLRSKQIATRLKLLNDSKKLKAAQRESLYRELETLAQEKHLHYACAEGTVAEIDQHNILGATRLAMQRALESLHQNMAAAVGTFPIIIDGRPLKPFPYAHTAIVKGDSKSASIALASIVAKVIRDRQMDELHTQYPQYHFSRHKGYGTSAHREALKTHGACPAHRTLFVKTVMEKMAQAELDLHKAHIIK